MKKILFLLILLTIPLAQAQSSGADDKVPYCTASLSHLSQDEIDILGVKSDYNSSCVCYQPDSYSGWQNYGCYKEDGGKMLQVRNHTYYVGPTCQYTTTEKEYQYVSEDRCKICNSPVVLSDWEEAGCDAGQRVLERRELAEKFNPTVTECIQSVNIRHKAEPVDYCETQKSITDVVASLAKIWFVFPIAILVYLLWRRKN